MQVSVIVSTRNSEHFLADALASVREQVGVSLELLMIDARSTDGSRAIAQRFGATVLLQEGRGLSDAWNVGVRASRSQFVAFLDSDDVWMPGTLAPRLEILSRQAEPCICVGAVRHVLADGVPRPSAFRSELFERDVIAPLPGTMVIDRRVFDRIGLFDIAYETAGDFDWIARAMNGAVRFLPFDALVLKKRIHRNNLTLKTETVSRELLEVMRRSIAQGRRASKEDVDPI
jgi:glycosyltransferase involved in cell wall biosynthesis